MILHLAAESHVDRSITASAPFIRTNIVGTYALLEAARFHWSTLTGEAHDAFRFVHVSTDEVYGSLGETGASSENSPYDPSSPYSASKAAADHLAMAWRRTYGLPVIISNCSNNYGPRQFPEKLIPLSLLNALEGKPVDVYGDGLNVRDWLHVEDHARALDLILRRGRPGERYNIGARCERRNIDTVHSVNGGRIPGQCGGVKAGHCRCWERGLQKAPDRGPSAKRRRVRDQSSLTSPVSGSTAAVAWFCSALAARGLRPADSLRR